MARTLVIGDSLGVGTAPNLKRMLGGKVVADTRQGRPSREGVAKLRQAMRSGRYDRVVFDVGTNDGSAAETARSLRQARRIVGSTPLFVATVNGPDAARKNRVIRRSGANVIDWASKGRTGGDGIHATAQGYRQRAQLMASAMRGARKRPTGLGGQPGSAQAYNAARAAIKPTVPAKPPAFVNTAKANPRAGQRFDIVSKGGVRYHKYANGLLIADKQLGAGTSTPEQAKAKGVAEVPTPGAPKPVAPQPAAPSTAPTPATTASPSSGPQVNQVKGSSRFGKSYETVTKGGRTFHRYKSGEMVPMDKPKPATLDAGRGPSIKPAGARDRPERPRGRDYRPPPRFTTLEAARQWDKRHPNASDRAVPRRGRRWGGKLNLSKRRRAIARNA